MTSTYRDPELRDALKRRDVQAADNFQVRHTDPVSFIEDLHADMDLGAIEDGIVRLSVTNGLATRAQIMGRWTPGADDKPGSYLTKFVSASYLARGQLVLLSAYCGVAVNPNAGMPATTEGRAKSEATAKQVSQTLRKVQGALAKYHKSLQVRGGGFYVEDGPWTADPNEAIEVLPTYTCVECGADLHFANNKWRNDDGQFEAFDVLPGGVARGLPRRKLNHYHRPDGVELDADGNEVAL